MSDEHPYPPEARHDWRAMTAYKLTDEQAYKLSNQSKRPGAPPLVPIHPSEEDQVDPALTLLRVDMIDPSLSHVFCVRCEVGFEDATSYPCPGDPVEHDRKTGEPVYEVRQTATGEVRRVTWDRWVELHPAIPTP